MGKKCCIGNGYEYDNGAVTRTVTEICHIKMEEDKISEIISEDDILDDNLVKYDSKEMLMLPAFKEMHIHIDKTYYGGPWKAVNRVNNIFDRFAEEERLLPELLPSTSHRAKKILETLLSYGSTHVRTHCNIDPIIGLANLEATNQALEEFSGKLSHEIVAFPQHGLLRSNAVSLVRQALKQGATIVGGVDPATVDGDIEKSLQTIMEIAVEANAAIDLHIHDRSNLGVYTMNRLADLTEEANWQGKVTVSHAFGFAGVPNSTVMELAGRFAKLGINLTSTVPIGNLVMPIPTLYDQGVKVELGTDSLTDHWSPFGNGDNLEKAGRLAELYHHVDEYSLSQSLGYITGGLTPLDKKGNQVWPKIGDAVNVVFVDASCSAEAIARRVQKRIVLCNGNIVSGSF